MSLDFTGISLPFDASDLVSSGMALLGVVGPFVLLGLAIMFVPRIIAVIRNAFGSRGRA